MKLIDRPGLRFAPSGLRPRDPTVMKPGDHHRTHLTKVGFCGELLIELTFLRMTRTRVRRVNESLFLSAPAIAGEGDRPKRAKRA